MKIIIIVLFHITIPAVTWFHFYTLGVRPEVMTSILILSIISCISCLFLSGVFMQRLPRLTESKGNGVQTHDLPPDKKAVSRYNKISAHGIVYTYMYDQRVMVRSADGHTPIEMQIINVKLQNDTVYVKGIVLHTASYDSVLLDGMYDWIPEDRVYMDMFL